MSGTITPLSNVDAAWLKMEDPTNLMMVTGVLTFAQPVDYGYFRSLVSSRLLQFERFRQRIVRPSLPVGHPYWEMDPYFNLDAHLHRIALPHPRDKSALQELASDLASTGLDFSKPPWQMHIVDGYRDGGAIVVRLHHSIADGMALVGVLLALTDLSPDTPRPEPVAYVAPAANGDGTREMLRQRASTFVRTVNDAGRQMLVEGLESYLNTDRPRQLAELGSEYAYAASKLLLRSSDPDTPLKGPLGVAKRVAWSRPLPLQEVKAMRRATGATINDLMTAAVTGGLRRYLESRGEDTDGLNIRAAVPVNMRRSDEMGEMGNKFGLVFPDLPVGVVDMPKRLGIIQYRMQQIKESQEAPVALDILGALGVSPQLLQNLVVKIIGAKASLVMTNVPGPPIPLYLAGQPIEGLMFWVPQSGRLGLGVSVISYAGNIYLGVITDAGLMSDPQAIINGFYMEYDELLALVD